MLLMPAIMSSSKPVGAHFDGNVYLTKDSDMIGSVDTKLWTFSTWIRVPSYPASGHEYNFYTVENRIGFGVEDNGSMNFSAQDSTGSGAVDFAITNLIPTDTWTHIVVSFDLTNPAKRWVYFNGASSSISWGAYNNLAMDFTRPNHYVGSSLSGNQRMVGDLYQYFNYPGKYIDLSVPSNLQKFISPTGTVVNMGSDGSIPFGTPPTIFMYAKSASNWATNKGSGGGFNLNSGSLTKATSIPA